MADIMKIEKLLFVTKFEELGFDAVRSLLSLTRADLNHVVFINVIERDQFAMSRVGYRKDEEIRLRETANIRFIDWSESLFEQGLEVGVYIMVGTLVSEVIKAAQKEKTDLIVIGRSNKGVLEHLYSGSDVTELLRRAATPVLVYKQLSETAISKAYSSIYIQARMLPNYCAGRPHLCWCTNTCRRPQFPLKSRLKDRCWQSTGHPPV
jgi:nucleotide-binding universal stress UspA family protein